MENPQAGKNANSDKNKTDICNPMTNTGTLVVFVLDAGGALPVADATVNIYKSGNTNGGPVAVLKSGESGKTEKIYLETPKISENSTQNEDKIPYALYDIVVELNGYYQIASRNIPVYPTVLSIEPVYMVPRPLDSGTAVKEIHGGDSEPQVGGTADA